MAQVYAFILLVVGLQSLLIFSETHEVDWAAGIPLALGSAIGTYLAAKLATRDWARVWVYRFLVVVVVLQRPRGRYRSSRRCGGRNP